MSGRYRYHPLTRRLQLPHDPEPPRTFYSSPSSLSTSTVPSGPGPASSQSCWHKVFDLGRTASSIVAIKIFEVSVELMTFSLTSTHLSSLRSLLGRRVRPLVSTRGTISDGLRESRRARTSDKIFEWILVK